MGVSENEAEAADDGEQLDMDAVRGELREELRREDEELFDNVFEAEADTGEVIPLSLIHI